MDWTLPLALLKTLSKDQVECEIANIDKLFIVCAVLINLGEGIVYNEKVNNQNKESNTIPANYTIQVPKIHHFYENYYEKPK